MEEESESEIEESNQSDKLNENPLMLIIAELILTD